VDGEEEEKANFEPDHESTPLTVKGLGVLLGGEIEAGPSLEERAEVEGSIEELEGSGIDGEEGSEVGEEARAPKVRRAPKGPTQLEREQHEATHLPFRDWCAHCVRGVGEKTPHRRKGLQADDEEDAKIPRMVLNYHFMSTRDAENGKNPVLAMKDESTGNRYMRAVGHKGVDGMDWLIKDLHEELKSWGTWGVWGQHHCEDRRGGVDSCTPRGTG